MTPLKVGYVVKRFPRASETFIAQEILGLERRGVEITILALRPNDSEVEHDWLDELQAPIHTYRSASFSEAWRSLQQRSRHSPREREGIHQALLEAFDHPQRSGRRYLVEALWIAALAEELGLQHLHAHFANHPAFVAMLAHLIGQIPYSFTAHAKDIYSAGPPPELWRAQIRRAAFAVTVSDANRAHLRAVLGSRLATKIHKLYNGVDLDRITPGPQPINPADPRVLFVSRLIEKKGADLLIDAAARLQDSQKPTIFTFVGDGDEAEALRARAAARGISDRVRFTGALPHQQVVGLMASSDLFVLPCRVATNGDRDALPTVLLEAMATGLPCVSTPVNGVPEIVDHGKTGLLVPENDSEALATAIRELLADPARGRAMGAAARRKAEQMFNRESNVGALHEWFEQAAGRTGDPPASVPLPVAVTGRGALA